MRIAHVGTIDGVSHQDIEKAIMKGPTRLENLQLRKHILHISSNGTEPSLFFTMLFGTSLGHALFQVLGALQGFGVGLVGQSKLVPHRSVPYLGSRTRSHATPPKFPSAGFPNHLVPVGQNMIFPHPCEGVFGVVLRALQIGCFGGLLFL
jgi:hypothetical protein